jgi:hypothetical protein
MVSESENFTKTWWPFHAPDCSCGRCEIEQRDQWLLNPSRITLSNSGSSIRWKIMFNAQVGLSSTLGLLSCANPSSNTRSGLWWQVPHPPSSYWQTPLRGAGDYYSVQAEEAKIRPSFTRHFAPPLWNLATTVNNPKSSTMFEMYLCNSSLRLIHTLSRQ